MVFGVILARLLSVEDFGFLAVLMIFVSLASSLSSGGFAVALIRKRAVTQQEYTAVFFYNILASLGLYVLLFFATGAISSFQQTFIPPAPARFLFLTFLFTSMETVPQTKLLIEYNHKSLAISNGAALICSGLTALLLAGLGKGIWAICSQTVVFSFVRLIFVFYFSRWKPTFPFSFNCLRDIFPFGIKSMLTESLNIISTHLVSNITGQRLSIKEAGYYSQANKWYNKPVSLVSAPFSSLVYPTLSKVNNDPDRQRRIFRKFIKTISFTIFPISIFFVSIAHEFILLLLKSKWEPAVPYLQLLCVGAIFAPLEQTLFSLLQCKRKLRGLFFFSLMKNLLTVACIIALIPFGLTRLIIGIGIINYLFFFIESVFTIKIISYRIVLFLKDVFPYLIIAVISAICTSFLVHKLNNLYLSLFLKLFFSFGFYLMILYFLKSEVLKDMTGYLIRFIKRHYKGTE